jgi:hypothetical protein
MKFTRLFNSEGDSYKQQIVFNFALITAITDNGKCFIVEYIGNDCYIEKDENSQKLFDYFAKKMDKDILGNGIENLQNKANDIMQMVANMKTNND